MKILALVPARAGSKRIPGKNARPFGGKPLILWSIDVARGLTEVCDTLVSTDDESLAEITKNAGALVPWLRPSALATDTADVADVALHALDWYEAARGPVDGLLLLQPTSPFRSRATVARGLVLFDANDRRPVLGVSPAKSHPWHCFRVENDRLESFMPDEPGAGARFFVRSQDLPAAYCVNGAFYLIAPADLRRQGSFYGAGMVPLIMDPRESIDIDTEADWAAAVAMASEAGQR